MKLFNNLVYYINEIRLFHRLCIVRTQQENVCVAFPKFIFGNPLKFQGG